MDQLINKIFDNAVWPFMALLSALAMLLFIYGIVEFIAGADSEEKRKTGKSHLIWGIVGLFIMASFSGIIALIKNFVESLR